MTRPTFLRWMLNSRRDEAHCSRQTWEQLGNEAGSSLLEVALTASMLLTLMFGIIDCARAAYIDHFLAHAAREATRYAMLRGATWGTSCASVADVSCSATSASVASFVHSIQSSGVRSSDLTVTTLWPGITANNAPCSATSSNAAGCLVQVTLTYSFVYASPLLPSNTLTLSSSSAATILQ